MGIRSEPKLEDLVHGHAVLANLGFGVPCKGDNKGEFFDRFGSHYYAISYYNTCTEKWPFSLITAAIKMHAPELPLPTILKTDHLLEWIFFDNGESFDGHSDAYRQAFSAFGLREKLAGRKRTEEISLLPR